MTIRCKHNFWLFYASPSPLLPLTRACVCRSDYVSWTCRCSHSCGPSTSRSRSSGWSCRSRKRPPSHPPPQTRPTRCSALPPRAACASPVAQWLRCLPCPSSTFSRAAPRSQAWSSVTCDVQWQWHSVFEVWTNSQCNIS